MHSPSDLEVITTRPKQRKADVPTISSSPVRTSTSRDSLTRNIPVSNRRSQWEISELYPYRADI